MNRKHRASSRDRGISPKSDQEIARMRRAGQIVALVLSKLADAAVPGVTTAELDQLAETAIRSFGAKPTFYGLYGYPANICVAVNDEVVHGLPGERALREGDIVSFDVGATFDNMIADAAITAEVGRASDEARRLIEVTREALARGIEQARPGNRVADISRAIQDYVESHGYSVVRKLVGHGVGREMHEPPQVPNFVDGPAGGSPELVPGMTLAVEPMVCQGGWQVVQEPNGWTYRTKDGSLAAHFEHTIAITGEGCEILTLRAAAGRGRADVPGRADRLSAQAHLGGSP